MPTRFPAFSNSSARFLSPVSIIRPPSYCISTRAAVMLHFQLTRSSTKAVCEERGKGRGHVQHGTYDAALVPSCHVIPLLEGRYLSASDEG
eukprot:2112602-Rhodomonas_salina.1